MHKIGCSEKVVCLEYFFVSEPCFIDHLIEILSKSILPFVNLIRRSNLVKFLVTSYLNDLKLKSYFIVCRKADLDILVVSSISREFDGSLIHPLG